MPIKAKVRPPRNQIDSINEAQPSTGIPKKIYFINTYRAIINDIAEINAPKKIEILKGLLEWETIMFRASIKSFLKL